ncbi:hypothetical protein QUW41_01600 [Slackia piriformis]|nr:hypothetical protein [Slackia piriformis]
MGRITQHPIRSKLGALTRALVANGFTLHDDRSTSEIESVDWAFALYETPDFQSKRRIALEEDGRYTLRTNVLATQLDTMRGPLPLRTFCIGRTFDGNDAAIPAHWTIEGIIVEDEFSAALWSRRWTRIAQEVYGISAKARLVALDARTYKAECEAEGSTFALAHLGKASGIVRTLLGLAYGSASAWVFTIDVDELARRACDAPSRAALYSPVVSFLEQFEDDVPTPGDSFANIAADVLRSHEYREFYGPGLYPQDAYQKMNMIMESWDLNNRGALLQQPFGNFIRVPTVLTPSLEDALEANYKAGEARAKVFEINHHYVLQAVGTKPLLKTSLSFGAYGSDLDRATFRAEVDAILTELGVKNHFFIPTDMAIPYDPTDCWVILDEHMQYLDGNFGSICQKARDAHGIGVPAYMAQIEIPAIERKSAEETAFVPNELR